MLKKLRVVLACLFWAGITLLLLDWTGVLHRYLGWMAKIQFLPAVLALNVGVIALLVLLTLVAGRVYCSVICPLGVFQDAVSHLGTRKAKAPYKYRKELKWLRYGVWVLFVAALVAGVQVAVSLLAPYSAYGRMVQNLLRPDRVQSIPTLVVALVTLVAVVALSLKGGRTYCNSICPVGTTLGFLSRFAMFRPLIDGEKCKHCMACEHRCKAQCISISKDEQKIDYSRCVDCFNCLDSCKFGALKYQFAWKKTPGQAGRDGVMPGSDRASMTGTAIAGGDGVMPGTDRASSRRAFMTGTAIAVGSLAMKGLEARAQNLKKVDGGFAEILPKQPLEREIPITPPGSASVRDFYRHCTACQLCVAQCPNHVLRPSSRPEHLMQPEMGYENGFCRPECTRCSELCPTGAIRKISREEKTAYRIGTAHVNLEACLSATGRTHCGKCARQCPVGAISMVEHEGHRAPVVAEEVCIGCGACEQYCPVRPISAIQVNGRYNHE